MRLGNGVERERGRTRPVRMGKFRGLVSPSPGQGNGGARQETPGTAGASCRRIGLRQEFKTRRTDTLRTPPAKPAREGRLRRAWYSGARTVRGRDAVIFPICKPSRQDPAKTHGTLSCLARGNPQHEAHHHNSHSCFRSAPCAFPSPSLLGDAIRRLSVPCVNARETTPTCTCTSSLVGLPSHQSRTIERSLRCASRRLFSGTPC